jgi:hypothetical protein
MAQRQFASPLLDSSGSLLLLSSPATLFAAASSNALTDFRDLGPPPVFYLVVCDFDPVLLGR